MDSRLVGFKKCFRNDVLNLVSLFNERNTLKYCDFVTLWNEMKFYEIFALFYYYPVQYVEFIREAFKVAVEFIFEEFSFEVRTAALYLLYALHCHQNESMKQNIPVRPSDWLQILKFMSEVNGEENTDIEYVFRCLLHTDAFEYCAVLDVITLSTRNIVYKPRLNGKNQQTQDDAAVSSNIDFENNILNDELMEQMGSIHEAYMQMKVQFSGPNATEPMKSLNLINPDFKELAGLNTFSDENDDDEDNSDDNDDFTEDITKFSVNSAHDDTSLTKGLDSVLERRLRIRQKATQRGVLVNENTESNDAAASSKQSKQTEKNAKRKFFSKMEDF